MVIADGKSGAPLALDNMVFQGTVLGSSLWNIFFSDVDRSIEHIGWSCQQIADYLSAHKQCPAVASNEDILQEAQACQNSIREWGVRNRVAFDPTKEKTVIIHHRDGYGTPFRFLGPVVDPKLAMHDAVDKLLSRARPKIRMLLKSRRCYNAKHMLFMFKTHIWGLIETNTTAIYHAAASTLQPIDMLQTTYIHKLDMAIDEAFIEHNVAPLCVRRCQQTELSATVWLLDGSTAQVGTVSNYSTGVRADKDSSLADLSLVWSVCGIFSHQFSLR